MKITAPVQMPRARVFLQRAPPSLSHLLVTENVMWKRLVLLHFSEVSEATVAFQDEVSRVGRAERHQIYSRVITSLLYVYKIATTQHEKIQHSSKRFTLLNI